MKLQEHFEALSLKAIPTASEAEPSVRSGPVDKLDPHLATAGYAPAEATFAPRSKRPRVLSTLRQQRRASAAVPKMNLLAQMPEELLGLIHAQLDVPSLAALTLTRKAFAPQERQALLLAWRDKFEQRGWKVDVNDEVSLRQMVSRYHRYDRAAKAQAAEVTLYIESLRPDAKNAIDAACEARKMEAVRAFVAPRGNSVTSLDFVDYNGATLQDLQRVWRLCPNLQRLEVPMCVCLRYFDKVISAVKSLRHLTDLAFYIAQGNPTSMDEVARALPHLKTIRLATEPASICESTVNGVLEAWPQLEQLHVPSTYVGNLPLGIGQHTTLHTLELCFHPEIDLAPLAQSGVRSLGLRTYGKIAIPVSALQSLTGLERIDLRAARLACDPNALPRALSDMVKDGRMVLPSHW